MTDGEHPGEAWTAFGLGVVGGVVAGLTLLSFAGLQPLGLLAVLGAVWVRPRPFSFAGLLMSVGVTWIVLIVRGATACGEPPCGMDPTPWIVASVVVGVAGFVLLVSAARRRRSESSDGDPRADPMAR